MLSGRPSACLLASCFALWTTFVPVAAAHPGHAGEWVAVDEIAPHMAGVAVRSVPGALGKLALTTSAGTTATVLGSQGQPLFRVGPHGVDANAAAAEWYEDNEPLGIAQVPPAAGPSAPVRWVRVSTQRTWEWFDHRLHPPGRSLHDWTIPLAVGSTRASIRGRIVKASGTLKLRLDTPRLAAGVRVSAIDTPASALRVRNDRSTPIRVLGPDGEVFARIGPRGAEVNVHSSLWLATAQLRNRSLLESVIDPPAKPRFVLVGTEPELIWPDSRLRPRAPWPSEHTGPSAGRREVALARWSVPIAIGDSGRASQAIDGATLITSVAEAAPALRPGTRGSGQEAGRGESDAGSGGALLAIAIVALTAMAVIGAMLLRQRR